ncbi:MAG: HYR domain-containing protein [Saprospiraceae bacterium]
MKTLNFIYIFILGCILNCSNAQSLYSNLCGDAQTNSASVIKSFGDGVYIASTTENSATGIPEPIFSKYNLASGVLMWSRKIFLNQVSLTGEILDFEYVNPDSISGASKSFILVGRTHSINGVAGPSNNSSFIIKIDDAGNLDNSASKVVEQGGLEEFSKIIYHPYLSTSIPNSNSYFIVGRKNTTLIYNEYNDVVTIYNVNSNCTFLPLARQYKPTNITGAAYNNYGLVPRQNGNLALLGYSFHNSNSFGTILQIKSSDGSIVSSTATPSFASNSLIFKDGIELSDSTLLITGEKVNAVGANSRGVIVLFDKNLFYPISNKYFQSNNLESFNAIVTNGNNNSVASRFSAGVGLHSGQPATMQFQTSHTTSSFNVISVNTRQVVQNGSSFLKPIISIRKDLNRILYADSRIDVNGLGSHDLFWGSFNLDFTLDEPDNCTSTVVEGFSLQSIGYDGNVKFTVSASTINLSGSMFAIPESPSCKYFCGPCPKLNVSIINTPSVCFSGSLSLSGNIGGTGPNTYKWDLDCNSSIDGTSLSIPYAYTNSIAKCVTVTVTDANGCSGSQIIDLLPTGTPPSIQCISTSLNTLPNTCYNNYQGIISITNPCNLALTISSQLSGATTGVFLGQGLIQFNKGTTTVLVTVDSPNNQSVFCQYLVTIIDAEVPKIICPGDIYVQGTFCGPGTQLTSLGTPTLTDNCPMVSYTSSHNLQSRFPCGSTVVTHTAIDMSGNKSTCTYNVNVDCQCMFLDSSSILCTQTPGIYHFQFSISNYTGSGLPCSNVVINSSDGVILPGYTVIWSSSGYSAQVMGDIQVSNPSLTSVSINASMTCSCGPNGPTTNCQSSINISIPCCKKATLDSIKICSSLSDYLVELNFNTTVNNITNVQWYYSCAPCLPCSWILYANTFDPFVNIYPTYLECQTNEIYLYAVVHLNDGTCRTLITNVSKIVLCNPKCEINNFETCYMGVPVPNAYLTIKAEDTCCIDKIEWYDPNGILIPGVDNLYSINVGPITFTGATTDCKQEFIYTAKLNTKCGIISCPGRIILYNNDASIGILQMDPIESPAPFCPTDFTYRFDINCPDPSENPIWTWYGRPSGGAVWTVIPNIGDRNPLVNTNIVSGDTYIAVGAMNGVCPEKLDSQFIDIIPKIKVIFSANASDPACNTGPIKLIATYTPSDCPVVIEWYKDGVVINTSTYSASPALYNYIGCVTCTGGNYYCKITSTCCPEITTTSNIIHINPPMSVEIEGPCFVCNPFESFKYTAIVTNPVSSICKYQWFRKVGYTYVPFTANSSSLMMINTTRRNVKVVVTCGSCIKTAYYNVALCKLTPPILDLPNITISTGTGSTPSGSFSRVVSCGSVETVTISEGLDSSIFIDGNLLISENDISDLLWNVEEEIGKTVMDGHIEIPENEDHFQIGGLNKLNFKYNHIYTLNLVGYYEEDSTICTTKFVLELKSDSCCKKETFISDVESSIQIKMNQSNCTAELKFNSLSNCDIWIESIDWGGFIQKGPFSSGSIISHNYTKNNISYLVKIKVSEYDKSGKLCNSTIVTRIINVNCQSCCKDFKKFKSLVSQGFTSNIQDCNVTITAPQFGDCYYFGTAPDFGDGTSVSQGTVSTDGSWTHQYSTSGIYSICTYVYGYDNQDTNQICWVREMCTDIKIECTDSCVCNAFSNLEFKFDKSTGVKVSCQDSVTLECPPEGCAWNLTGDLLCKGDCPLSSVDWKLVDTKNNIIIASGTSMSYPQFGLYVPPYIFEKGGRYILQLKGNCESSSCVCSIILKLPGCNSLCPCVEDDLASDVNAGLQILSVNANCLTCFQPKQLQECDQVKWYLIKKPNVAFASSIGNQIVCYNFGGSGSYQIKMSVIRNNDDGTVCDDYERVFTLNINCLKGPGGNNLDNIVCHNEFVQNYNESNSRSYKSLWTVLNSRTNWKTEENVSENPYLEIKGNSEHSDLLVYSQPICFESGDQNLSLDIKWRSGVKRLFGTKLHLYAVESIEDINLATIGKNGKMFSLGTYSLEHVNEEWLNIQNIFNLDNWNTKSCTELRKSAYLLIYVDNCFINGNTNSQSIVDLKDVCLHKVQILNTDKLNPEILPNPSNHNFILKLDNENQSDVSFEVNNCLGEQVYANVFENELIQFSFGDKFSPGVYFVKIKRNGINKVVKIIKL